MSSESVLRTKAKMSRLIQIVLLSLVFLILIYRVNDPALLPQYFNPILMYYLAQTLRRICFFLEELFYLKTRYKRNLLLLIEDSFYLTPRSLAFFVLYIIFYIICLSFNKEPLKTFWYNFGLNDAIILFCIMLMPFLKLDDCPVSTSVSIQDLCGLDYGSGMAYSFFYGYLRIVLPSSGRGDKAFKDFIMLYESKENVTFKVPKLFILLPMSCRCFETLQNEHFSNIEEAKPLDEILQDVAGVKKRSYKNSVYKIKDPQTKEKVYASVEFATPLRTFLEVIKQNTPHSGTYEKYRNDIVLRFYITLKQILKRNPECGDVCDLIYYNDINFEGKYINVANIILRRIHEIKSGVKKKKD